MGLLLLPAMNKFAMQLWYISHESNDLINLMIHGHKMVRANRPPHNTGEIIWLSYLLPDYLT